MNDTTLRRLTALLGIAFSAGLFGASRLEITPAELAALACFVPFATGLSELLRRDAPGMGVIATTGLASGLVGITLRMASIVPHIVVRHDPANTPLTRSFEKMGDVATTVALYPLAVMLGMLALAGWTGGLLPRWLTRFGAGTALLMAINAGFLDTNFVPGLLLFVAWALTASVVLLRPGKQTATVTAPAAT